MGPITHITRQKLAINPHSFMQPPSLSSGSLFQPTQTNPCLSFLNKWTFPELPSQRASEHHIHYQGFIKLLTCSSSLSLKTTDKQESAQSKFRPTTEITMSANSAPRETAPPSPRTQLNPGAPVFIGSTSQLNPAAPDFIPVSQMPAGGDFEHSHEDFENSRGAEGASTGIDFDYEIAFEIARQNNVAWGAWLHEPAQQAAIYILNIPPPWPVQRFPVAPDGSLMPYQMASWYPGPLVRLVYSFYPNLYSGRRSGVHTTNSSCWEMALEGIRVTGSSKVA